LTREEQMAENSKNYIQRMRLNIVPNSSQNLHPEHVDLKFKYKDYNYIKSVIKTRTIDMKDNQDLFDNENRYKSKEEELNLDMDDHEKF